NVDRRAARPQGEVWLVTMMRICRQITDTRLTPRHLRFRHNREAIPAEFRTFLGIQVEFGTGADEIVFPAPVASLPVAKRDNYLNDLLRRYADDALAALPRHRGRFRSAVEDTLPQLLPHGKASAFKVAQQLGMSARTLARKLN